MTIKPFQPLLAWNKQFELSELTFPWLWSPKLDGIRTMIKEQGPVTRKIKLVPNEKLRAFLDRDELRNIDGEMIYGDQTAPDVFNKTQSAVMKIEGPCPVEAGATFLVFDDFTNPEDPFEVRFARLETRVAALPEDLRQVVKIVPHRLVENIDDLINIERIAVEQGYEGIMLRKPGGHYKYGRSTFNEGILLKVKRFEDAEATITGVEELFHNENEKLRDELGHAKRSTNQENLVAGNTLGAIVVDCEGFPPFKIGSGWTQAQRQALWGDDRGAGLIGRVVCFKYQPSGMKDVPRFPVFKGFRKD